MTKRERDISEVLETLDIGDWRGPAHTNMPADPVTALENGKVLYFPRLAFELVEEERRFLSPQVANAKAKNVSFDPNTGRLKHAVGLPEDQSGIKLMIERYHESARALVRMLLPQYVSALEAGRTSFRPSEIAGRHLSAKKDDTRLHVDAFPSTPTAGKRILRVFTNVNPRSQGRDWRLGEQFEEVVRAFAGRVPRYSDAGAFLLSAIGATESRRSAYDHLMLNMHDMMKADEAYQRDAKQSAFSFPPGSTWMVYTDQVSHAAMGGQYLFEQTFYLPVSAMADSSKAPLCVLERVMGRSLV